MFDGPRNEKGQESDRWAHVWYAGVSAALGGVAVGNAAVEMSNAPAAALSTCIGLGFMAHSLYEMYEFDAKRPSGASQ